MHTLKVLYNKLKQACPFIHLKRLAVLMLATQALLIGQPLSLTQLGRRLVSTGLVKHNIKRIDWGSVPNFVKKLLTRNKLAMTTWLH